MSADHNPYTPPDAAVADQPRPVSMERPRNVTIALGLIGAALAMQILAELRILQDTGFQAASLWPLVEDSIYYLCIAFLWERLSRAKGWARLVLLLLNLWAFAMVCYAIGIAHRYSLDAWEAFSTPQFLFMRVLPMILGFLALHLLYFSSGGWFGSGDRVVSPGT